MFSIPFLVRTVMGMALLRREGGRIHHDNGDDCQNDRCGTK
jgi:hypothetical protein